MAIKAGQLRVHLVAHPCQGDKTESRNSAKFSGSSVQAKKSGGCQCKQRYSDSQDVQEIQRGRGRRGRTPESTHRTRNDQSSDHDSAILNDQVEASQDSAAFQEGDHLISMEISGNDFASDTNVSEEEDEIDFV